MTRLEFGFTCKYLRAVSGSRSSLGKGSQMTRWIYTTGLFCIVAASCQILSAAPATAQFPFVMPRNEAAPNDLDMSFLNEAPVGNNGFAVAAHLAKYGVNVVRLHHPNNTFGDPNTSRLAGAWRTPDRTDGPNLYAFAPDRAGWMLENIGPDVSATLARASDALRVDIAKTDSTNWHIQLYKPGQSLLQNGKTYILSL